MKKFSAIFIALLLTHAVVCGPLDSLNQGLHKLGEFGQKIGQEAKKVGENVVDSTKNMGAKIGDNAKTFSGSVVNGGKAVGQFGKDTWDSTKKVENKAEDAINNVAHEGTEKFKKGLDVFKDFKQVMGLLGFGKKDNENQPNPNQQQEKPAINPTPATQTSPQTPGSPQSGPSDTPTVIQIPNWRPPVPHGQDGQINGPTPTPYTPTSSVDSRPSWKPATHPGQGIFSSSTASATAKAAMTAFTGQQVPPINGQRGQYFVGEGLKEVIAKLADEKIRNQLIDGFFGVMPQTKLSEKCTQAIDEVKSLPPLILQYLAARQLAADSGNASAGELIGSLSFLIKADAVVSKVTKDAEINACLSGSLKPLKVVIAKLLFSNEEFIEKVKQNTEVWTSFASVAFSFQLEMYESAGKGFADIIRAISKTQVSSLPDAKAERLDMWKCLTITLKAKSQQKIVSDDPEGQMNSWILAANESKKACLATADLD
jgi:hypothetical protein